MKLPRAVFFDLDGTLSDSLPDIAWALNEARIDHGIVPVTDGQVRGWVGGGAETLVARSLGAADERDPRVAPMLATFLAHYEAHACERSKLYDGVVDLLEFLEERGVRTACTTNKPEVAARGLLVGLEVMPRFDALITPETCGGVKKPDARFMGKALSLLGVAAKDALVVGDGVQDVEAARNAGIRVVAVLGGYGDRAALRAAGADEYVESMAELAERLIDGAGSSRRGGKA
jgi:phosphoglycolate phosphatase